MSEEVRDNMRIVWDAPIEMSDGIVLQADVFRPVGESTIPAILSYGPYAKGCLSRKVARSHGSG
jgi:predicted acyl esterase